VTFGRGPQLLWGPNASGKTSLIEAIVVLAWGRSHRTSTDAEMIRWNQAFARVEGRIANGDSVDGPHAGRAGGLARSPEAEAAVAVGAADGSGPARAGAETLEVVLMTAATGPRKRIRVNGIARRASGLLGVLRIVVFAPEEMLLVAGSPSLRRTAIDQLAGQRSAAYLRNLSTYARVLQQRNGLLRAIREERAGRGELRFWNEMLVESGGAIVAERLALLEALRGPVSAAHREIAPEEGGGEGLVLRYETNAPGAAGETPRDALARRLDETAEKEVWNGTTLVGPHRDDIVFELAGRDLAGFASRGQQRTAILAFKLAELDLLTELDDRPPLLLLDDVFSELDPARRGHLVRRIAALPQSFVTTTTLEDLDPQLRAEATSWAVIDGPGGVTLMGPA